MKINNLTESVKLARIFILNVNELRRRRSIDNPINNLWVLSGCKESGAVRRASMDLTRSLSKLRNE